MAIDEAIFLSYRENISLPTLRLYGWKPAAISIGYSQNAQDLLDLDACRREGIDVVQRPTGGGIIFHDRELTYSIVLSQADLGLNLGVKQSFEAITSFLLKAYQDLGATAVFAKDASKTTLSVHSIAAFCFSRNEEYDILVNGKKLGGNAQKRKRRIILQHGSIPLAFDKEKAGSFLREPGILKSLDTTCIHEIAKEKTGFDRLSQILINAFSSQFKVILKTEELTPDEKLLAEELKTKKYSNVERDTNATCSPAGMA
jgi:lipoate-protein ligase A